MKEELRQRIKAGAIAIESDDEYQSALAAIDRLFDSPAETAEVVRRDALVELVLRYEQKHFPIKAPTAEGAARFRQEQRGKAE